MRRVYRGPVGELQRATLAAMRPGVRYRLPTHAEDGQRRRVLDRLLERGLVRRVDEQANAHLVVRAPRRSMKKCLATR